MLSLGNMSALPFTYVAHLLGIVSVVMVFIWTIHFRGGINYNSSDTNLIFNVHSALMLLSMVFLYSEAMLAFKGLPGSKAFRKLVHLILHMVALVLGIVGVCAAFKHHNIKGINNLYSLHSWLGIITMILYGLQWVVGFISFFFPGSSPSTRATMLPWHVFAGLFIYGLSLASTETGFLEKLTFLQNKGTIARISTEAMFVNVLGLIVILLGMFVSIAVVIPEHQTTYDGYNPI